MEIKPKNKLRTTTGLTRFFTGLIFFVLVSGVESLHFQYVEQASAARKKINEARAEATRARIESELQTALSVSQGLAAYLQARGAEAKPLEIQQMLAAYYREGRHVRSLGVVVGDVLAQVYPARDNDILASFDYAKPGEQFRHSDKQHAPLLLGPLNLAADVEGFVCLSPIFAGDVYGGLVSAAIDTRSLLAALKLGDPDGADLVAVRGKEGKAMIFGERKLFEDADAALTMVETRGLRWMLALKAKTARDASANYWIEGLRALGWLLSGLFAWQAFSSMKLLRRMAELALYDELTGLPSRPLFFDRLKQMIRRTKRNRGHFSVLFMDLDAFEKINQQYGRKAGDMMLAGIGKRLMNAIRHYDTVTRWGGDEFVVLLDDCGYEQALVITETLRHKIHLPVSYGERLLRVGASVGVATYPEDGHSLSALLKVADARLYEDKVRRKAEP
jgi:diguanylate cyclase (GGDEF)-like protein